MATNDIKVKLYCSKCHTDVEINNDAMVVECKCTRRPYFLVRNTLTSGTDLPDNWAGVVEWAREWTVSGALLRVCSHCNQNIVYNPPKLQCGCSALNVDEYGLNGPYSYWNVPIHPTDPVKSLLDKRSEKYGPTWFIASMLIKCLREWKADIMDDLMDDGIVFHNWFMILGKLMRLLKSPRHLDSWQDIAGYARLVTDYLENDDINEGGAQ